MSNDPDRPPAYAIPLRRALLELSGDPLIRAWWLSFDLPEGLLRHTERFKRYEAASTKRVLSRLQRGELDAWGAQAH